MAPTRSGRSSVVNTSSLPQLARKTITSGVAFVPKAQNSQENLDQITTRSKRRADLSPLKNDKIKRSALGNLTNNVINLHLDDDKTHKKSKASASQDSGKTTIIENDNKALGVILKTKSENAILTHTQQQQQVKKTGIVLRSNKVVTRAAKIKENTITSTSSKSSVVPLSAIHNQLKKQSDYNTKAKECFEYAQKQQQQEHHKKGQHVKEISVKSSVHLEDQKQHNQKQPQYLKNVNIPPPKYAPSRRVSLDAKTRRISNEFEKTEDTLYMSALEEFPLSGESVSRLSLESKRKSLIDKQIDNDKKSKNRILTPSPLKQAEHEVPEGVIDFDKENWDDPFAVSHYAMDIFNYMKRREAFFPIDDYMERQTHITKWMRSLLVDWMVEVQETFELNHETVYLAVKLVDLYLTKVIVQKDKLQLLGAASLFIASKFDERTPPLVDDFLYICDGAYLHKELIRMEMSVLKTIDFDLSIPLSYRFLRRYARTSKIAMPTLTLARYILEFSLMDYTTVSLSDSQLACAALFMALKMKNSECKESPWTKTLEYYSGYKVADFGYIIPILNAGLNRKPKDAIKTIRNKYSHKIFFEVSKIPLLTNEKLFENTGLLGEEQNISEIDNLKL
ncbi:G2/mitotic-specific cyclin-B3 [Condylostylus longicornis]|uniref:G2/mitotic-specific cyclin-B3 n=1 Tax=Condylostylus longicornis TaxID=2530218 RepID=UPI00244E46C7|nr:G2/mitotic-specific cyclin-B3 [Condylostylus longicornis]